MKVKPTRLYFWRLFIRKWNLGNVKLWFHVISCNTTSVRFPRICDGKKNVGLRVPIYIESKYVKISVTIAWLKLDTGLLLDNWLVVCFASWTYECQILIIATKKWKIKVMLTQPLTHPMYWVILGIVWCSNVTSSVACCGNRPASLSSPSSIGPLLSSSASWDVKLSAVETLNERDSQTNLLSLFKILSD